MGSFKMVDSRICLQAYMNDPVGRDRLMMQKRDDNLRNGVPESVGRGVIQNPLKVFLSLYQEVRGRCRC